MALFERWLIANGSDQEIWIRSFLLVQSDCSEQLDFKDIATLTAGHLARHGETDSFLFVPNRDTTSRLRPAQAAFNIAAGPSNQVRLTGECSLCRAPGCRHIAAGLFAAVSSVRPDFLDYVAKNHSQNAVSRPAASFLRPFFASAPTTPDTTARGRLAYVLVDLPGRNCISHLSLEYWQAHKGNTRRSLLDLRAVSTLLGHPSPELKLNAVASLNALAETLSPADRRCLRQIFACGAMNNGAGHVNLAVDGGHAIFESALATGHLVHEGSPRTSLQPGAPRNFDLAWMRQPRGVSSLNPRVAPSGSLVPSIPPWYVDVVEHSAGPAFGILSPEMASALPHATDFADSDLSAVHECMLFVTAHHGLPAAPEYEQIDLGVLRPVPCVHLYFKPVSAEFDPQRRHSPGAGRIHADLSFDYRGNKAPSLHSTAIERALQQSETMHIVEVKNGQRLLTQRDLAFELEVADHLLDHVAGRAPAGGAFRVFDGDYWTDSFRTAARQPIKKLREHIASIGGRVTSDVDFIDIGVEAENFVLEVGNQDGSWFDFGITADIHGERRDMTKVIRRLLADPKLLQDILSGTDPELVVQVDSDVWAAMSRDSLKQLIPLFQSLDFERTFGRPRFSRVHTGALVDAQKALNAEIVSPSNLRDLIQRLHDAPQKLNEGTEAWLAEPARPYQKEAAGWSAVRRAEGLGGVIADEYGVGKTVQGLLTVSDAHFETRTPSLIVVTKTLFVDRKWQQESARFLPAMPMVELRSTRDLAVLQDLQGVAVVITTYNTLALATKAFNAIKWNVVLADEGHKLGNHRTAFHNAFESLRARQKLIITGSPLLNSPTEIWALMNLCVPGLLQTRAWFEKTFPRLKGIGATNSGEPAHSSANDQVQHNARMTALGRIISPFQLRRTNASLNRTLPPVIDERRAVVLSRAEADLYDLVRLSTQEQVQEAFRSMAAPSARARVLPMLLRMRQVCADWRLLKDGLTHLRGPGAKSEAILEICEEFTSDGKLVLITSEWSEWLSLLHQDLTQADIPSSLVIGSIGGDRARAAALGAYRRGETKVLLLQLVMAEGVDLPETDVHVIAEPWWNRAREDQATARARRDERNKTVTVIRMHVAGSVEDGVEKIATLKTSDLKAINTGAHDVQHGLLTQADIESMLNPLRDSQVSD